jgi:hypothetical protein
MMGTKPVEYEAAIDPQTFHDSHRSVYLRAKGPTTDGFGALMQDFRADHYYYCVIKVGTFSVKNSSDCTGSRYTLSA